MVAATIDKETNHNNSLRLAKPDRKLVYQFGKGELDISRSTMDFLMYLSPFVDLDGRIVIPLEQARYDLKMQSITYSRVIREARYHQLIIRKGNKYYSRFHIHTDGSDNCFNYIKLINAYTSPTVLNYSLRYKRLFYYFISVTRMGSWQRFHIENLYSNKVRKDGVGVDYFESFKEVSMALLQLVRDGLIEIKLPDLISMQSGFASSEHKDRVVLLKADSPFLEEKFYSFFGFSKGEKKIRTSLNKSKNHVIQVKIASATVKDELKLAASEQEFIQFAESYSIAWNELNKETPSHLISYKNDLFKVAGEIGLTIYRKSIQAYLKEHSDSLLHYDEIGKLANYFMDFYLLKEIRNILTGAAYHQKQMNGLLKNDTELIVCHDYRIDFNTIGALLVFYQNRGSMNHKVLLDGSLMQHNIDYKQLTFNHSDWIILKNTVENEYETRRALFLEADSKQLPLYRSPSAWRQFMIDCAEQGLFVKKQAFDNLLKNKQAELQGLNQRPVKRVPFYNWLTERD
ncbi:hypothetical protein [Sporosarcina sp. FSL K6-1508]|uniref:hypothetical protein n=1 Tax=Sporosarcina sp. FSL K6-1508 TaxID=2921553 RepID=UPI0030F950E0